MFKRTLDLGITLSAVTTLPQSGGLSIGRMLGRSFSGSGRQFEGSGHTALYARYRPRPPPSLVRSILRLLDGGPATSLALDVGCGSGQFTGLLAPHFSRVVATDVSEAQVEQARTKLAGLDNVELAVGSGEMIQLAEASADLVTVCQALHWMQVDSFYQEAARVLRPGGLLAVLGYHFSSPGPGVVNADKLREAMARVYAATSEHWSAARRHVDSGYTTLARPRPGSELQLVTHDETSHFADSEATFGDWLGYIRTWSGLQNMLRARGEAEVATILDSFTAECANLMGVSVESLQSEPIVLRTRYWLTVYQNQK